MNPFANVTRLKGNRGGPPNLSFASKPASGNGKPKPKPAGPKPNASASKPAKPKASNDLPVRKRARPSSPTDTHDENELPSSPPPPSSRKSRKERHTDPSGAQSIDADNDDSEVVPPPQRPDNAEWTHLIRILYGPTSDPSSLEVGWKAIYDGTCKLVRTFPLHVNVERALTNSLVWCDMEFEDRPALQATEYDDNVADEAVFHLILDAFPKLEANFQLLCECPSLIKIFADFISKVNGKVRSNDLVRVNKHLAEALDLDIKNNQKHRRGFKNPETGRLLCPINRLHDFDRDPDVFCRGVIDADPDDDTYQLLAVDWPLAIYHHPSYDREDKLKGLLRSRCCLKVYQIIYLGPAGAISGHRQGNKGQQSVAKKHDIKKATIESIIRSAAIARFALSSTAEWIDRDGDFDSPTFVRTLLDVMFLNPKFTDKLVDWYTSQVFGSGKSQAAMRRRIEKSAYGQFKKQKHELDPVPGAWYRRRIELAATTTSSDSEQSDTESRTPPRDSPSDDELEYAANNVPDTSDQVSGRKRKRGGEAEEEERSELGDPGDGDDENWAQMGAENEAQDQGVLGDGDGED